jgi:hypothetical protein
MKIINTWLSKHPTALTMDITERAIAMKVVSPDEHDNFMTVSWKVSNKLPKWVLNTDSWIDIIGKELYENDVDKTLKINKGIGGDEEEKDEEQEDEEEGENKKS